MSVIPRPSSLVPSGGHRRPPRWAVELLDALVLRRWLVVLIVAGISIAGIAVATFLPALLPPRALAGAAVGLAACLLGVAAAIAVDAGDPVVRGPRHVLATGAALAAQIVGADPSEELVDWVEQRLREEDGLRLAILATGDDPMASGWLADELGAALARRGLQILVTDLHQPKQDWPGASEVCSGEMRLSEVVEFHPTLRLARLGSGHDHEAALAGFPALAARLPRDVDAFFVALPGLPRPGTLPAAAAADRALLLVAAGRTTRVELIAALDAIDEARVPSDVVLITAPWTADRLEPLPPSHRIEPEGITVLTPPPPEPSPPSGSPSASGGSPPGTVLDDDPGRDAAGHDPGHDPGGELPEMRQAEDTVPVLVRAEGEPGSPSPRRVTISSAGPGRKPPPTSQPAIAADPPATGGASDPPPRRRRSNGGSDGRRSSGGRGPGVTAPALVGSGSPTSASSGEWLASGTVRMVEAPVGVLDRKDRHDRINRHEDATPTVPGLAFDFLAALPRLEPRLEMDLDALPTADVDVDTGERRIDDPEASLRLAMALDRLTEKLSDSYRRGTAAQSGTPDTVAPSGVPDVVAQSGVPDIADESGVPDIAIPETRDAEAGAHRVEIAASEPADEAGTDHVETAGDRSPRAGRSRAKRSGRPLRPLSEGPSLS